MVPDLDTLLFFDGKGEELALYGALCERLERRCGPMTAVVHRTQISLKNRRVFACVSFLRARRKALLPEHYLVLTLGLPYPLSSPRIAVCVEARPSRWTHHIVLASEDELDDELLSWAEEAYVFAAR